MLDPVRNGILDPDRMWRINVAGMARIMEAIGETNRYETIVQKFIVAEQRRRLRAGYPRGGRGRLPLGAHTLPYAIHKKESEKVIQQRAPGLTGLQRLCAAAAHFRRCDGRELHGGRLSRHPQWAVGAGRAAA